MSWRNAKSIVTLLQEVNRAYPNRSKRSDGTIGDADHQNRRSDHNPWVPPPNGGVVTAVDITHDPRNGPDSRELAETFRKLGASGDPRIKYVISHGRIASRTQNWAWRNYTGPNGHFSHVHLSVTTTHYDDTRPWGIAQSSPPVGSEEDVISQETHGKQQSKSVRIWQRRLNQAGRSETLKVDGIFGPKTEAAVRQFQKSFGVDESGVIDLTTAVQLQAYAHGRVNH